MFGTYLFRELTNRRKQTAIIAIGMALAIALVIIVNGVSAGVSAAQAKVLESVYGVGTDITVSQQPTGPTEGGAAGGPPSFDFGSGDGSTADGSTQLSQARLTTGPGSATFADTALATVQGVDNVSSATATLSLTNINFSGEIPDFQAGGGGLPTDGTAPPTGGADGAGGSSFDIESITVTGIDVTGDAVGPLTAVSLTDGRSFDAGDVGTNVVVLDSSYATTAELGVGDTLGLGGEDFEVIGIVASTSSDASSTNTYIPLDTAQRLAGLDGQISTVYVQAASSTDISQIQSDIETVLPDAAVKTQADLASSVSGSLSTASSLVSSLGTWLSVIVLAAAFLISILFTIAGVTRRTREFGTLKAVGWSNGAVVRQVAGESLVQGAIGGVIGVAVGLLGILVINLIGPVLSGSATTSTFPGGGAAPGGGTGGFPGGGGGGPFGQQAAAATTDIVLQIPVTATIILVAVGLAILGGLLAGAIGGWRAARLRPAEALRSVA
ncbi:MAG TPA: ABC transporter permease [Rhodoglobus sp.]|nr:ABC transporter permease [Rhodoglobus sp.]